MVLSAERVADIESQSRQSVDVARTGATGLPPVPAARYVDADFARLEAEAVFGRAWLFVAHGDQLPEPGDFLLLDQLAKPIVLVRDDDGAVRAFFNTCTHRGAALVAAPAGNAGRRITCPYHAWTFSLDGSLTGYPDADAFGPLDRDCAALRQVRCEQWGPLVFVNMDADAPPLAEFLGTVGDDLSEIAELGGRLHLARHTSTDVPVNWKVPVDANIETYHVNVVHRDSAARALRQADTGIQLLRNGHSRMLVRARDGIDMEAHTPFPPVFEGLGRLPFEGTFSYHVFPNLSIVFAGTGFVFFITNWPSSPSASVYRVHWCSSLAPDADANRDVNDRFVDLNQAVLMEDLDVLPGVQRSVDAGAIDVLRLGWQERRIYHVHEAIDRAIGVEKIPERLRVAQVLAPDIEE